MLDWLMNIISSLISFIMGLFGLGGTEKRVRFEDEEKGDSTPAQLPTAEAVAAVLAGTPAPSDAPTATE